MKRVFIVGSGGSGKTTLANIIAKSLDCQACELDALFWNDHWESSPREEFERRVQEIIRQDSWVVDGNYRGTVFDHVFERADTFIWLDFPRWLVLSRCFWRNWRMLVTGEKFFGKDCPPSVVGGFKLLGFVNRTFSDRNCSLRQKAFEAKELSMEVVTLHGPQEVKEFVSRRIC